MLENKVLGRIYGSVLQEVTENGDNYIMMYFISSILHLILLV
jgi:hypothetical protein